MNDEYPRVPKSGGRVMLRQTHSEYLRAFRGSTWLARLNLVYLAVVPAFLVGSLVYLIWVYLTV